MQGGADLNATALAKALLAMLDGRHLQVAVDDPALSALLALVTALGWSLPGWLLLVATIVVSMFITSLLGVLVERVGYRPLRSAPRASAAITGLMIGIILEYGNLALSASEVELGESVRRLHLRDRILYESSDFTQGNGVWLVWMNIPASGASGASSRSTPARMSTGALHSHRRSMRIT